jgi:hypothetical protein
MFLPPGLCTCVLVAESAAAAQHEPQHAGANSVKQQCFGPLNLLPPSPGFGMPDTLLCHAQVTFLDIDQPANQPRDLAFQKAHWPHRHESSA